MGWAGREGRAEEAGAFHDGLLHQLGYAHDETREVVCLLVPDAHSPGFAGYVDPGPHIDPTCTKSGIGQRFQQGRVLTGQEFDRAPLRWRPLSR